MYAPQLTRCSLCVGARLLADRGDGVELLEGLDDSLDLRKLSLSPASPASPPKLALSRTLSPRRPQLDTLAQQAQAAGSQLQAGGGGSEGGGSVQQQQPQARGTITILFSAVGLGLQFMQLQNAGTPGEETPRERPGSAAGSSTATSRQSSAADLAQLVDKVPLRRSGSATGLPRPAQRAVQLLAAYMDVEASLAIKARSVPSLHALLECLGARVCMYWGSLC